MQKCFLLAVDWVEWVGGGDFSIGANGQNVPMFELGTTAVETGSIEVRRDGQCGVGADVEEREGDVVGEGGEGS